MNNSHYVPTDYGRKSLCVYGRSQVMRHFAEELCELYAELCHYVRPDRSNDIDKVAEEMADVLILADELALIFAEKVQREIPRIASVLDEYGEGDCSELLLIEVLCLALMAEKQARCVNYSMYNSMAHQIAKVIACIDRFIAIVIGEDAFREKKKEKMLKAWKALQRSAEKDTADVDD